MNLTLKWMAECTTVKDVAEQLAIDAVTKLMPRPIANHVRDHSPATLTDATKLADSFMQTRGWSHDQTGDNEGRSHEANERVRIIGEKIIIDKSKAAKARPEINKEANPWHVMLIFRNRKLQTTGNNNHNMICSQRTLLF